MKKLANFILCMMLVSNVYADFKIIGGLNLSKYNVLPKKENIDWDYKVGFLGGIGLERNFNQNLILEFDFLYFQKGSKIESKDPSEMRRKYNLKAFSIPVLLRFKFLDGSSPYILGGVEFSFIISHEVTYDRQEPIDLKENTKNIDYGMVFGLGYELEIQEYLFFFVEARYHLGQRNIINIPVEVDSIRNNSISIVVGMRS